MTDKLTNMADRTMELLETKTPHQLAVELSDAQKMCRAQAELLREIAKWILNGDAGDFVEVVRRIDALLAGQVPEPRITQPARIGGIRFNTGIKVSTVIEAAYRAAEYEQTDGKANFDALMAVIHDKTPEGWQLVPVEPSIARISAATAATTGFGTRVQWDAMLAAAPKPQGGE